MVEPGNVVARGKVQTLGSLVVSPILLVRLLVEGHGRELLTETGKVNLRSEGDDLIRLSHLPGQEVADCAT